ncbi:MAG: YqeG family HAD IIIA-type phosphatase [Lachnospiraceae bacterium]|nr:YqeG family HAD IIIA-type phosphatase [Lachnospiraceae bacterium]
MNLFPDERAVSAYTLPYEEYRAAGIRGVIFDIDNTLVRHGEPAVWRTVRLFAHLKELGLTPFILSNNKVDRVRSFAEAVGADYVWKAGKPKKYGYLKACGIMGITPAEALAVGDQIYTDIWGAKRSGMRAVLVDPIDPREELQIRIKRWLERPILALFLRRKRGTAEK